MNKTAIKNFAIQARNKLIADVCYRAGLVGITEKGIQATLPQSNSTTEFYDIGIATPYAISGQAAIRQRRNLAEAIRRRAADSDYPTAYRCIMEEVAYTWFNRLIAVRFMEVNDYLPGRVRVLSSESGKIEPDLVTNPFDAELNFTAEEEQAVLRLKQDNKLDELFRLLFIKQCNALAAVLPALFEQTEDYTELLLNLSVVDQEGVVWHLTHDIPEDDFNVEKGGQVEIIGWLYQYYNTEPKAQVFARPSGQKIKKEEIPAATQLFTPDWIVRYMVENSLGRLWLEYCPPGMACGNGEDALRELWTYYIDEAEQEPDVEEKLKELRQQHLLSDPTQIKLIDPCMGSGHILVYAFEVLFQIYYSRGYSERDIPALILQHNLYGLDIDKRAYQLAYFAVMMKARQYDRRFLTRGIEPNVYEIQASNGKYPYEMGNFLLSKEHQETLNYLLEIFQDAKEYGSLLKLEQRDYTGLLEAWQNNAQATAENVNMVLWYSVVEEIVPALIKQAIVLTQKYDVVVTNPPYMGGAGMNGKLAEFVKEHFPDSKADLFASFIERGNQMVRCNGYNCMVTMQSWMFLSSFEKMRTKILSSRTITNLLHMENMVMGIAFGTAVSVFANMAVSGYKGTYNQIKLADIIDDKPGSFPVAGNRFAQVSADSYLKIEGCPVAYWISEKTRNIFINPTLKEIASPCIGMRTGDNERFIRFWFEVAKNTTHFFCHSADEAQRRKKKWFPYNKGGAYRRWYGNCDLVVNWENNGEEIKAETRRRYPMLGDNLNWKISNERHYFENSITWSDTTSGSFSGRFSNYGALFDVKGSSCFPTSDIIYYVLGLLNTKITQEVIAILNPTVTTQVGDMARIPIIIEKNMQSRVEKLSKANVSLAHDDWDSFETSWDFKEHPLVTYAALSPEHIHQEENSGFLVMNNLADAYHRWEQVCNDRFQQLKTNEEELNRIFIDIYGLQDELTPEVEDKDVTVRRADLGRDIRSLISYAVGCMFGRYSLDVPGLAYAGGDFGSVYRKDRLVDEKGNPITFGGISISVSKDYTYISRDGTWIEATFPVEGDNIIPLTDEAYLEDDIVSRLCQWLRAVYGENTLEENLNFIATALGNKGSTSREVIRNYFLKDFFADHCKIYQKRPIYWLFDSGKQNGFKALVYLHRYAPDTIGKLRVDYLHRLQRVYASEIERMQDMIDNSQNPREVTASTKRKEKLQKQLKECREYDEKIAHLALARIELDLDDGVKVNYRKVQTASDGKLYEVLADSKNIMGKQ